MGRIVGPIFTQNSRLHWWYFWLANMAFHWIPFGLIWLALAKNREPWISIGVDWGWFYNYRVWFGGLIILLIAMAFVMPGVLYEGELPKRSHTVFMAPVSTAERLFIHGTPRNLEGLITYTAAGLAFGVPFILMKLKRLEILVLIHFAIDAGMVLAP